MSWKEFVDSHPLWTNIRDVQTYLNTDDWPDDIETRDTRSRVAWLCDHVFASRETTDHRCITRVSLDNANSAAGGIRNTLQNLRSNGMSYAQQVHEYCDSLLASITTWQSVRIPRAMQSAREAVETFEQDMEHVVDGLRRRVEEMHGEIIAGTARYQESEQTYRASSDEAMKRLEAQVVRIDSAITQQADSFQAAQRQHEQEAAELRKEMKNTLVHHIDDSKSELEALLQGHRELAEDTLTELGNMHTKAGKVLEAIGAEGTASHYVIYASEQRRAANRWNLLAVTLAIVGAGLLYLTLHTIGNTNPSWALLSVKTVTAIILLSVAGYAGKEAAGHRAQERHARSLALALAALDPFLANMDEVDTRDVRLALAATLFTGNGASKKGDSDTFNAASLVNSVLRREPKASE